MRELLEDKNIDAVSFATPNHWHALGTVWACQAGKHVYVEKPASHNVREGRLMVEAAREIWESGAGGAPESELYCSKGRRGLFAVWPVR